MGIFQGTADQIASKDFVKSEINAFKKGEGKKMAEQRIPKIKTFEAGAPFDAAVVFSQSDYQTDDNGNKIVNDSAFKSVIVDDGNTKGVDLIGAIVARDNKSNIWTNTPIHSLDCANKKYVDDVVKNAGGGGSADLSNYYTKAEIDAKIGDIETLLGGI